MARRLSFGEVILVTSVVALGGFVGAQALASSPRRPAPAASTTPTLSPADSAEIARAYWRRIPGGGGLTLGPSIPKWMSEVHIGLLQRSAVRTATRPGPRPVASD